MFQVEASDTLVKFGMKIDKVEIDQKNLDLDVRDKWKLKTGKHIVNRELTQINTNKKYKRKH